MFGISIQVSEKLLNLSFVMKLNNFSKLFPKKFTSGVGHLIKDVITWGGGIIITRDDKGEGGQIFPKWR